MKRVPRMILGAAATVAIAATVAVPQALPAGGDYGPNTCLNGFVWRNAFPGDVVCVSTDMRERAAFDNARAAVRRDPHGAYGPNSCKSPYVWRVARPSDLVCVPVSIRRLTAADNAAAASRRNSVKLTLSRYFAGSAQRWRITVTNVNVGRTTLFLKRASDGSKIQSWWPMDSVRRSNGPGGRIDWNTNQLVCNGQPNAYFVIQDPSSKRWSNREYVRVPCSIY